MYRTASRYLKKCFGIAALLAAVPPAMAAGFPSQPIHLIVGFPPGGGGDLYGRLIAQAMSKSMGQSIVVENKPGAGGNIAAGVVAKSRPDGYTLLMAMSGNIAVAPVVESGRIPYKSPEDFTMIGSMVEAPYGLFVPAKSKFKTAQDFLAATKSRQLTIGSTSPGGAAHIVLEMVKKQSKANLLYVPYRGTGPGIIDMLAGQIDAFFVTAPPVMSQVKGGNVRILAITGEKPNPGMPGIPTFKELGIPVVVTQWYGLAAPAGTPPDVVQYLAKHLSMALADPQVRKKIEQDGAVEKDESTNSFLQYVKDDIQRYRNDISPDVLKGIK